MSNLKFPFKLYDTPNIPPFGRLEKHWVGEIFNNVFEGSRRGPMLPLGFKKFNPEWLLKHFNCRGWEFGNWLSQEDRWLYLVGCSVSLYDLSKITGLYPAQLGFGGMLSTAFGARGSSRALAHFEPRNMAINLTRYDRETKQSGDMRFLLDGGVGSLGHEWAHALDFFFGYFATKDSDTSWATNVIKGKVRYVGQDLYEIGPRPKDTIGKVFFDLMQSIMYEATGGGKYRRSKFYDTVSKLVAEIGNGYGEYWIDPKEIFARSFETFLSYEGAEKGIMNPYLHKNKYIDPVYPTEADYQRWGKHMRKLLKIAKSTIPEEGRPFEDYFNQK
jgi:hypothetical protein